MQKYKNESLFPISFFTQSWLSPKLNSGFSVLHQMPNYQIDLFLLQAKSKNKTIIIQTNKSSLCTKLRESKGKITHISLERKQVFVSFKNTVSIIDIKDIRHIRLA